jgi:hypothetical protein
MVKASDFEYIKDKIDDILNEYETQGEKGFIYERLVLVIFLMDSIFS